MTQTTSRANIDHRIVEGFGDEWDAFDQTALSDDEQRRMFDCYFSVFPFESLPPAAEGFDLGCGSGRLAATMHQRVGLLHCIDPSDKALAVANRRLAEAQNVRIHLAGVDDIPLADGSQDFGYSLGVLHHIPNTQEGMQACTRKLKPGAPFLVYLYYSFDNRPAWFRGLWKLSDLLRRMIHKTPFALRKRITDVFAALVYWPLARTAALLEKTGMDVDSFPLSAYRRSSFYSMRTDSLDRFGTGLEQRFSKVQIETMMRASGLADIRFSNAVPYWVAVGRKTAT